MWLKQQNFISHKSRGWKSKIKVPACLVSGESSSLSSECTYGEEGQEREGGREKKKVGWGEIRNFLVSLLIRTQILSDQGFILMTSFNLCLQCSHVEG